MNNSTFFNYLSVYAKDLAGIVSNENLSVEEAGSFSPLPDEQILQIIKFLGLRDIHELSLTCRLFYRITDGLNPDIVSCFPKVTKLVENNNVSAAVYDLSLNIIVLCWKEISSSDSRLDSSLKEERRSRCGSYGAIYDLTTGIEKEKLRSQNWIEIRKLMIDAAGQRLIGAGKVNTLVTWKLDGSLHQKSNTIDEICNFALDAEGDRLFAKSYRGNNIETFDLEPVASLNYPQNDAATEATLQNYGMNFDESRNILCSNQGNIIQITNMAQNISLQQFLSPSPEKYVFLQERGELIYLSENGALTHVNYITGVELQSFSLPEKSMLLELSYSKDGDALIASITCPDEVKKDWSRSWITIWDLASGAKRSHFMTLADGDCSYLNVTLLYLPDSKLLIAGTFSGKILIWDTSNGEKIRKISLDSDDIISQISLNQTGNKLFVTQKMDASPFTSVTSCIDFLPSK